MLLRLSLLLVLALPGAAAAAFPGPSGRLVFVQPTMPLERSESPRSFLCSAEADGSAQSKLSAPTFAGNAATPAFSADGSQLALVRGLGRIGNVVVAGADGSGERPVGQQVLASSPSWSPDGTRLYLSSGGDLHVLAVAGGATARLTATPDHVESFPVASPDGTRLAYVDAAAGQATLVIAGVDAASPRPLATFGFIADPDWSPDSTRLVFAASDGIWVVSAHGGSLRRLRSSGAEPAYAPDGERIAFVDDGDVWTMNADGTGARRIVETPLTESDPAWQRADAPIRAAGSAPCAISGTSGDDLLVGTDGPDVFLDLGGNDVIRAGDGDDVVVDGDGDDVIETGGGEDDVRLRAGRNRVDGGAGDDALGHSFYLVEETQVIVGGSGDDTLLGGQGADRLEGGDGHDGIAGLRGPDTIRGGPGDDRLQGNRGDDHLDGGLGDDVLFGGLISGTPRDYDGYDVLLGSGGADRLAGGWQKDRLFGGPGADRLRGGPHADHLVGEAGRDDVGGETGDDLVLARDGGRDLVSGGPGVDRARVDAIDRTRGVERSSN